MGGNGGFFQGIFPGEKMIKEGKPKNLPNDKKSQFLYNQADIQAKLNALR